MQVHLTLKSNNAKTGPIPVSTSSRASCPPSCSLKSNGCYADSGPLAIHWNAVTSGARGSDWTEFCDAINALPDGQLWRHNQAGDLPGADGEIDSDALNTLVTANLGKKGFTYTHYPMTPNNIEAVSMANMWGFTVNLSAENLAMADSLANFDAGPVVTLLPADVTERTLKTPEGRTVVVCPATYRGDVSCATCALCAVGTRKSIVGFPAHGASKAKATRVFMFAKVS